MKNAIRLLVPAACLLAATACSRTERTDRDNTGAGTGTTTTTGNTGTTAGNTGTGTGMGTGTGAGMGTGTTTDHTATGQTTVTGANVAKVGNDVAIRRLVESRCARETSCNNIGSGKKYTSNDVCMNKIQADMKDDLNAKECPHGIDQKQLDTCLQAIKNESCNNPIDKVSRITACRTSDLCMATSDKNR